MPEAGTIRYTLLEPFEQALETIYKSLATRGLRVAAQLDVSRRMERALGIALPPCRIAFVLPSPCTPNSRRVYRWAAVFLPLHIVISGKGPKTEIQVQNRVQAGTAPTLFGPVMEAQTRVSEALEGIAMRSA